MKSRICILLALMICMLSFLSGCSELKSPSASSGADGSSGTLEREKENSEEVKMAMQDAFLEVQEKLRNTNLGYQWIERDYFYIQGEKQPALWLFAVNELGDYLDVLIMDVTDDEMGVIWEENSDDGVFDCRKNERCSYDRNWHVPAETEATNAYYYMDQEYGFSVLFSGTPFTNFDLELIKPDPDDFTSPGELYWDGKGYQYTWERPEEMKTPIDFDADPGEFGQYQTYCPAETAEDELAAMQKRLSDSGLGYEWEIKDSITVDGQDYPVTWMYAKNDNGEWVDVVFTQDPEFCYFLQQNRELFDDLRASDLERINDQYPARTMNELYTRYGEKHSWLIQDCFYHGYYYFMDGYPLAMMDAGAAMSARVWNDADSEYDIYLSRNAILYKNIPAYEP